MKIGYFRKAISAINNMSDTETPKKDYCNREDKNLKDIK